MQQESHRAYSAFDEGPGKRCSPIPKLARQARYVSFKEIGG